MEADGPPPLTVTVALLASSALNCFPTDALVVSTESSSLPPLCMAAFWMALRGSASHVLAQHSQAPWSQWWRGFSMRHLVSDWGGGEFGTRRGLGGVPSAPTHHFFPNSHLLKPAAALAGGTVQDAAFFFRASASVGRVLSLEPRDLLLLLALHLRVGGGVGSTWVRAPPPPPPRTLSSSSSSAWSDRLRNTSSSVAWPTEKSVTPRDSLLFSTSAVSWEAVVRGGYPCSRLPDSPKNAARTWGSVSGRRNRQEPETSVTSAASEIRC